MSSETAAAKPAETDADPFAGTPYENSPEGWWMERGGALDVASGVIYFPPGSNPPHPPFPCRKCRNGAHQ